VINAEQWYDAVADLQNYYQGDVLSDFPLFSLPTFLPAAKKEVWGVLRPRHNRGRPIEEVLRNLPNELIGRAAKDWPDVWTMPHGEHIIASCKKMRLMLVSRSCDIDKHSRKHFLVAPVVAVTALEAAQVADEKLRDIRDNNIFHWFYLPAKDPQLPESIADLSQMMTLHRSFFDDETLCTNLVARLSSAGTAALQSVLSDFYGTKFGFAPEDRCPQTAHYACSACFHAGQPTPRSRDVNEGEQFGGCGLCGENTLWVKLPGRNA
jgi:hypothetical protein